MSAVRAARLAQRLQPTPHCPGQESSTAEETSNAEDPLNDSYVSWHWRGEFLERFSDALGGVRTRAGGQDYWFTVQAACSVPLEGLPEPGTV
ncbi:unnamed protein product, partial [Prorocentrum cordatum]